MSGTTTDAGPAGPGPFGLLWAVKPSFISYVSRMPDGKAYLTGGVGVNADNELVFPLQEHAPPDEQAAGHTFAFGGDVLFRAHYGMLSVRLTSPQVSLRAAAGDLAAGELTVLDPDSAEGTRLPLVTFTAAGPAVKGGTLYWAASDVLLTTEGVPLFGDVYQASEPFAPLMIAVPAGLDSNATP
jgi:hypothetical protein